MNNKCWYCFYFFNFILDITDLFIGTSMLTNNGFPIIFESVKGLCKQSKLGQLDRDWIDQFLCKKIIGWTMEWPRDILEKHWCRLDTVNNANWLKRSCAIPDLKGWQLVLQKLSKDRNGLWLSYKWCGPTMFWASSSKMNG